MRTLLNIHQPIAGWALASILMFSPFHWAQSPSASGNTPIVLEEVPEEVWEDVFTYVFKNHIVSSQNGFKTFLEDNEKMKLARFAYVRLSSQFSDNRQEQNNQRTILLIDENVSTLQELVIAIEKGNHKIQSYYKPNEKPYGLSLDNYKWIDFLSKNLSINAPEAANTAVADTKGLQQNMEGSPGLADYMYFLMKAHAIGGTVFNLTNNRKQILNRLMYFYFTDEEMKERERSLNARYLNFLSEKVDPCCDSTQKKTLAELCSQWKIYYTQRITNLQDSNWDYFTRFYLNIRNIEK